MKNLKFILLTLIVSLLFSSQGFAQTYIFQNNLKLVAQGTSTAANTQLSLVDGTAFAFFTGVDLSAYQTGKHLLCVYNASTGALIAMGYCSATAPSGETLTNIIAAPTFLTGWLAQTYATIVDDDTFSTTAQSSYIHSPSSVVHEALYKSKLSASPSGGVICYDGDTGTFTLNDNTYRYCTVPLVGYPKYVYLQNSRAATTDVSVLEVNRVDDCAATGVRIVSAKSGATQNWLVKGAGAVNSAISYKVYYIGD